MTIENAKTLPICVFCGSYDVTVDASVSWNYDRQDWVVDETFDDNPFCNKCMKNREIMWITPKNID